MDQPADIERCEGCGFDGARWTDEQAVNEIAQLPQRWREAVGGLTEEQQAGRPDPAAWSIAEYTDHVRETLFGMRFILTIARETPGADLGEPPIPEFATEPKVIDVDRALHGIEREAEALVIELAALTTAEWTDARVVIDGNVHAAAWIARHAVHDATHHLLDVARLRDLLGASGS